MYQVFTLWVFTLIVIHYYLYSLWFETFCHVFDQCLVVEFLMKPSNEQRLILRETQSNIHLTYLCIVNVFFHIHFFISFPMSQSSYIFVQTHIRRASIVRPREREKERERGYMQSHRHTLGRACKLALNFFVFIGISCNFKLANHDQSRTTITLTFRLFFRTRERKRKFLFSIR